MTAGMSMGEHRHRLSLRANLTGDLRGLVGELTRANVDVIATAGTPAALAAQEAAPNTPIVLVIARDPVRTGLAKSLNRPGGLVTGLTTLSPELNLKRLELRRAVPDLSRLGVLWAKNPAFELAIQDTECRSCAPEPAGDHLWTTGVRRRQWLVIELITPPRPIPARGGIRREDPQGRQGSRLARRSAAYERLLAPHKPVQPQVPPLLRKQWARRCDRPFR